MVSYTRHSKTRKTEPWVGWGNSLPKVRKEHVCTKSAEKYFLGTKTKGGHTHGFSFQPIKMELKQIDGTYITLYEWDYVEYLDVMYVPAFHRFTYRFMVEDRPFIDSNNKLFPNGAIGRWLAHCHIFGHSHSGMMMEFIVLDENNSLQKRCFPEVSK